MVPILLDKRDLIKLGLLSIGVAALVFSGGFISGYEKAAVTLQVQSEVKPLDLPEKISVFTRAEHFLPEIIAEGAEIDVDQPAVTETVAETISQLESLQQSSVVSQTELLSQKPEPLRNQASTALVKMPSHLVKQNATTMLQAVPSTDMISAENELNTQQLAEVNYSLQVGMYGSLPNAENMVERLQAKEFDAYVSSYTNKNDEIRYNVRLGYFVDKKAALIALKDYKKSEKADGYLVKIKAEDIIDKSTSLIAKQVNNDQRKTQTIEADSIINKISQADINTGPANDEAIKTN